jgi:hypothetical protein
MVGSILGVYNFGQIFVSARTNKRHHHLEEVIAAGAAMGFISNLNGNQTKQNKNRSENMFSWKTHFTNKGQIFILKVCVIAALQIIYHTAHK